MKMIKDKSMETFFKNNEQNETMKREVYKTL